MERRERGVMEYSTIPYLLSHFILDIFFSGYLSKHLQTGCAICLHNGEHSANRRIISYMRALFFTSIFPSLQRKGCDLGTFSWLIKLFPVNYGTYKNRGKFSDFKGSDRLVVSLGLREMGQRFGIRAVEPN